MAPGTWLKHKPQPVERTRKVPRGSLLRPIAMTGFRVPCECTYDLTHTDRENPFVQEGCGTCDGKLSILVWGDMCAEWEMGL